MPTDRRIDGVATGSFSEQVRLRVFVMPCCGQQLCWVSPRTPNHCPECGARVLAKLRTDGTHTLLNVVCWLRASDGAAAGEAGDG